MFYMDTQYINVQTATGSVGTRECKWLCRLRFRDVRETFWAETETRPETYTSETETRHSLFKNRQRLRTEVLPVRDETKTKTYDENHSALQNIDQLNW